MKQRRRNTQRQPRAHRAALMAAALAIVLCASLSARFLSTGIGNLALLSAGLAFPEGGRDLLSSDATEPTGSIPVNGGAPSGVEEETQLAPTQPQETAPPPVNADLAAVPEDIRRLIEQAQTELAGASNDGKISEQTYTKNNATDIFGEVFAQNKTHSHSLDLEKVLQEPVDLKIENKKDPYVLIFHTHTTESYLMLDNGWYTNSYKTRSNDPKRNMVRVGEEICAQLEAAGFGVIHDTNIYDTTYSGAYDRSAAQIDKYLEQYPTIQVVLDIHRDAIKQENGTMIKPTATINGKKAAQIMILTGCQELDITNFPDWEYNLRFAAQLQKSCQENFPGLVRPLYFCARQYNMEKTRCSLLVEMGSDANTLDEATYSGRMLGKALALMMENYVVKA